MGISGCPVAASPGTGEWPTAGADERVEVAAAAMRAGGLMVAGPAGSGKTHLARAVLRGSDPVHWVRAGRSARTIPFGAFLPLLGSVPASTDVALMVAHRTLAISSSTLVVDDAHLLDDLSATLVSQLAGYGVRPILLTLRTGQPAPDPITALWKDGLLERLELPRPTVADCVELAERFLGGRLQTAGAALLHRASAGNLCWLRHLVSDERAAGRLRCTDGLWHWAGRGRLGSALTELVMAEIGEPPEAALRVLELVALAGRLDVDVLARLTAPEHVEEADDRRLIAVTRDGASWTARPAHPLYADVVADRLSPLRARRLCGRLVDALRSDPPARRHRLQLGRLALRAGRRPDPELLLAAAHQAAARLDLEHTVRLAAAAGAAGAGFEADLLLGLGHAWSVRGADAERRFRGLARAAAADEPGRLRLAQARAVNLAVNLARPDDAQAVLDATPRSTAGEPELLGVRALLAGLDGRLDDARHAARRAFARDDVSAVGRSYAGCALELVAAMTGDAAGAPPCQEIPPDAAMVALHRAWWSAHGLGVAGRTELLRRSLDRYEEPGGLAALLMRSDLRGWLALVSGQVATAVPLLTEFRTVLHGRDGGWTTPLELRVAMALGMSGQATAARAAIDRARSARHPAVSVFSPHVELAEAWASAAEGSPSIATRHARKAALLAGRAGQFAVEVMARHAAVTFGDKGQSGRLAVLARRLRSPRAVGAAAHAAAFDAGDDAGMLDAAEQFASAGLMLLAAEAAAQAEAVARARRDSAATAAAAAAVTCHLAECDGTRTPALELAARPLAVSGRQREIAAMVAAGLSNREISERLGVSVRTVEGHVYHACIKLGIPNRTSLAALLNRSAGIGEGTSGETRGCRP